MRVLACQKGKTGIHVDSRRVYLKDMTKMEEEQQGRPSKARRPLIALEFEEVIERPNHCPTKKLQFSFHAK